MLHIIPLNDLEEHEECSTCKCNPILIIEEGEMILIHNSFDKREFKKELNSNNSNKE